MRQNIQELRNAINAAIAGKESTNTSTPAKASESDMLDTTDIQQLQALKQLYDSGILTAEEFAAKKAQILGL